MHLSDAFVLLLIFVFELHDYILGVDCRSAAHGSYRWAPTGHMLDPAGYKWEGLGGSPW